MGKEPQGGSRILSPELQQQHMAREIESFKELDAKQTRQFLANLNDPRHIRRSREAVERVRKMRFTIVE